LIKARFECHPVQLLSDPVIPDELSAPQWWSKVRSSQLLVCLTNSLIYHRFSLVVPVLETTLWAKIKLDSDSTRNLSLVGVLSKVDLSTFLDHAPLLAENTRLRFHLTLHIPKHLCTCPNGSASTAGPQCGERQSARQV